jgi:hypothetical protein
VYELPAVELPALVVGGEGEGLRQLVRRTCDFEATLPMAAGVESLERFRRDGDRALRAACGDIGRRLGAAKDAVGRSFSLTARILDVTCRRFVNGGNGVSSPRSIRPASIDRGGSFQLIAEISNPSAGGAPM